MSAAFTQAAEDSKKLLAKPSNDELLELYGTSYTLGPPVTQRCCTAARKGKDRLG